MRVAECLSRPSHHVLHQWRTTIIRKQNSLREVVTVSTILKLTSVEEPVLGLVLVGTLRHLHHGLLARGQQVLDWDWLRWSGRWGLALMGTSLLGGLCNQKHIREEDSNHQLTNRQ